MDDGTRYRRRNDMHVARRNSNGWRNSKKRQQRRHQKSAADAKKARYKPDSRPERQINGDGHRHFSNRQIERHQSVLNGEGLPLRSMPEG